MKPGLRPLLAAVALCAALRCPAAVEKSAVPFREIPFAAATEAAAKEGKLIFIDFYTTWCEPCKRLDTLTWTDAGVGKLIGDQAVALKLDAEKEGKDLAQRYKINLYPTLLLLKADGVEVDRIEGFREPALFKIEFNKVAALAQAGKSGLERAKEEVAAADADEAQPHFDLARKLAKAGQSAEALKELNWCWDEGKKDPEFVRTRSTTVAREYTLLARTYPPAREAMIARRDDADSRALAGKGGSTIIQDVIGLNKELKDDDDTIAVYDKIPEGDRRRVTVSIYLFDVFLAKQRYADAALYIRPETNTETMLLESTKSRLAQMPGGASGEMAASTKRYAITRIVNRVEALVGVNRLDEARALAEKVLAFDGSEETKALLQKGAARAGHAELFAGVPK